MAQIPPPDVRARRWLRRVSWPFRFLRSAMVEVQPHAGSFKPDPRIAHPRRPRFGVQR